MRNFISYTQNNWVELLPQAEWSYNNHVSSATGFAPFYLWYGEYPQFYAGAPRETIVPEAEGLAQRLHNAGQEAKAMIQMATNRYKEQADRHRQEGPDIEVGDQVFINARNIKTDRPTEKLDYKYLRPFEILEKVGKRATE